MYTLLYTILWNLIVQNYHQTFTPTVTINLFYVKLDKKSPWKGSDGHRRRGQMAEEI